MSKVTDYDTYDYDYSTYWKKREYEHNSEVLVLEKLFKNMKGNWFLDIGGSFGRLSPIYSSRYTNCVILDYSLKTLQKNYSQLKSEYPNTEMIAANAYYLPFRDNSFDGAMMVRVLHHIEEPKEYIKEMYRILGPNDIYIQEFANKFHIKAVIKALLKFDFAFFNNKPYQQPNHNNYEGTKEGSKVLFFNYNTGWITNLFSKIGLKKINKYGCSFLRLNILKRIFNTKTLLTFENIFQNIFSWTNFAPSIFLKTKSTKKVKNLKIYSSLNALLACPKCKGDLELTDKKATCKHCKHVFEKKQNIWDFRI